MTAGSTRDLAVAMAQVARALQAAESPQATLQKMADLAVTTLEGCEHAGVSIVRPDGIETPAASDDVPLQVDRIQFETNQGPCVSAIYEQDMYITPDLRTEDRWPAFATRATAATGVRSMLSFRLFVEKEDLGALNFYSTKADAFDADSIVIGRLFAAHAAIALAAAAQHERAEQRARLLERKASISIHLQRSLLTRLPDLAPLTAAARYVPAVEAAEIGGDWYDAVVLPSGDVLLVIGDVIGHDIDAAIAMAQARTALRTLAVNYDESPADLLTRLDDTLTRLGEFHIGTCAAVRITRRDGQWYARLATAGHPQPLLMTPATIALVDMPHDVLLGVTRSAKRHTTELLLPPGSTLLLYTDGLVERRDRPVTDGQKALVEIAENHRADDLEALCDALLEQLAPRPTDDVCLLAVRLLDVATS